MSRGFIYSLCLIIAVVLSACGDERQPAEDPALVYTEYAANVERDAEPAIEAADFDQFISDGNRFALKAYFDTLDESAPGQIISPFSLRTALALIYAGAEGQTKSEMASALNFSLSDDVLHPGYNKLLAALESRNLPATERADALVLNINNSIWPQLGSEPNPAFLDVLGRNYGQGVYALDYRSDPDAARRAINDKVEQWTEGRIEDVLPVGSVSDETLMVLTSTIYLYAPWNTPFMEGLTAPRTFNNIDGTTAEVDTMRGDLLVDYGTHADAEVLVLPFRGGEMDMVFLVPSGDFMAFAEQLDGESLTSTLLELNRGRASLSLPRFKLEYTMPAVETLKALGMTRAFTEAAEFGPVGLGAMYISEVAHKAFIEVTEAGTEAAAATAVVPTPVSITDLTIEIDRPFVFLLRDSTTGAFLFIGHVAIL